MRYLAPGSSTKTAIAVYLVVDSDPIIRAKIIITSRIKTKSEVAKEILTTEEIAIDPALITTIATTTTSLIITVTIMVAPTTTPLIDVTVTSAKITEVITP